MPLGVSSQRDHIEVDVVIVGAGIAGLWLGNLLAQRGLSLAICESGAIGGTQTAASQGIVHSGLKYALDGRANRAAKALAAMPARWRACLAGRGEIDLRGVPVLAQHMNLFAPSPNAAARALFAGPLAEQCRRLDAETVPPYLRGVLAEIDDFVLSVPALIRRLGERLLARVIPVSVTPDALVAGPQGLAAVTTPEACIDAQAFVFAAGGGNEALAPRAGFADVRMARRPLRQTSARLDTRQGVFAHCLASSEGADGAMAVDMTITSHDDTLYIGGQAAEDGAERDHAEQVAVVRRLLTQAFPGIDLSGARFGTHRLVRAEPVPDCDDALAARRGNCVFCWPFKLSLAPRLGDMAMALLRDLHPRPNAWTGHRTGPKLPWARPPFCDLDPPC